MPSFGKPLFNLFLYKVPGFCLRCLTVYFSFLVFYLRHPSRYYLLSTILISTILSLYLVMSVCCHLYLYFFICILLLFSLSVRLSISIMSPSINVCLSFNLSVFVSLSLSPPPLSLSLSTSAFIVRGALCAHISLIFQ